MRQKRKLTEFGLGLLITVGCVYFIAGLSTTIALEQPNSNHGDHNHFVSATWIALTAWLLPYALAGLFFAARAWVRTGKPGLFEKVTEPVDTDLRDSET